MTESQQIPLRVAPGVGARLVWAAIIIGVALLALWAVAAQIQAVSHYSTSQSLKLTIATFALTIYGIILGTWLKNRGAGGQVLVDCEPHPAIKLISKTAWLWVVIGVADLISWDGSLPEVLQSLTQFSTAAFQFLLGRARIQVREEGIWDHLALLPWSKIDTYRWADGPYLHVWKKRVPLLPRSGTSLAVPPDQKETLQKLLFQSCAPQSAP